MHPPYRATFFVSAAAAVADSSRPSTTQKRDANSEEHAYNLRGPGTPEQHARGIVMAHVSHSYPDGASLYFTFIFPRQLDREVEQWQAIKRAASDAILMNGGTISHHHGVGADHVPWLAEEKGAIGMSILKATKREMDPKGVMNPGKLLG